MGNSDTWEIAIHGKLRYMRNCDTWEELSNNKDKILTSWTEDWCRSMKVHTVVVVTKSGVITGDKDG